jgi:hypothetical protein
MSLTDKVEARIRSELTGGTEERGLLGLSLSGAVKVKSFLSVDDWGNVG